MRSFRLLGLVFILAAVACGGGGGEGGGGGAPVSDEPPPVDEPADFSLRTTVPLEAMGYQLKGITACLQMENGPGLPAMVAPLTIDGDLGEWANVAGAASDPVGDAEGGKDLAYVGIAARGEDLALGLGAVADTTPVYFEIGGLVARNGALVAEVKRLFKHASGQLFDFDGGSFKPVAAELGQSRFASSGGEVLLSRRLIGDVVGYPLWWVRAFTKESDDASRLADSTTAAYFTSLVETDDPKFVIKTCKDWSGRSQPISLVQIRDTRTKEKNFPLEESAARVHELARLAVDASILLLGEPSLPTAKVTTIATANKIGAFVDKTGFGLDADLDSRAYHAFVVDARTVAPNAVDSFPQGPVVRNVAAGTMEMVLTRWLPAASQSLMNAWRTALDDHLVRKFLGKGYWLDAYQDDLAGIGKVTPLAPGDVPSDGQALGFGRLLGAQLEPKALVTAWKSGGSDALALKAQVLAQASSAEHKKRLDRLWPGWLIPGPFDADFAPAALGDEDVDGVPDHIERLNGTNPEAHDTDRDGWTDLGEFIYGSDPKVASDTPSSIMPDGDFGDWQQLLPKRLGVDRGKTGLCPKAADVEFFAALATRDELVVGAVAHEYWENEPAARWEVEIDIPSKNEQLLVSGIGGSREYVVQRAAPPRIVLRRYKRAMPVARRTIEWSLDRRAFGLETYLDVPSVIRLRIRTLFTKDDQELLCDETDWFVPSISKQ